MPTSKQFKNIIKYYLLLNIGRIIKQFVIRKQEGVTK